MPGVSHFLFHLFLKRGNHRHCVGRFHQCCWHRVDSILHFQDLQDQVSTSTSTWRNISAAVNVSGPCRLQAEHDHRCFFYCRLSCRRHICQFSCPGIYAKYYWISKYNCRCSILLYRTSWGLGMGWSSIYWSCLKQFWMKHREKGGIYVSNSRFELPYLTRDVLV